MHFLLKQQPPLPFSMARDYENQVLSWASEVPDKLIFKQNCAYGSHANQCYDVFTSRRPKKAPILIFWHGGGWTNGYKEYVAFMAKNIVELGMILVAPDYRLAPEHKISTLFDDALSAVKHVSQHAHLYGGCAEQLYLAGHSAGAHLAALVALRRTEAIEAGINVKAIRAALLISGIMNLYHPAPSHGSLEALVYSKILQSPTDDAIFSPVSWTQGNRVPILLSYGEADSERVIHSNQRLASLLQLQPASCRLSVETGLDHFTTHTSLFNADAPWYQRLSSLIKESPGRVHVKDEIRHAND